MFAEVDQFDSRQLGVLDNPRGRVRHEDLASASGVADAGCAGHAEADISVFAEMRLGRVEAHPHEYFRARGPPERSKCELRLDCCRDGFSGAVESNEEAVAGGIDLASALRR